MGSLERDQSFLHTADAQAVKDAIAHRASGGFTPLFLEDSGRSSTNSLLGYLYKESGQEEREKIAEALQLLLEESIQQEDHKMLREAIVSIGQLQTEFSHQVAIDYLLNSTENPNIPDDTDIGWTKGMVTAVLAGRTKDSQELTDKFSQWYWSTPITIGNEHAAQLLTGIIERDPKDLPKLLERLVSINESLPEKHQFRMSFVWMNIVESCPEDVFQEAMSNLPVQYSVEYHQLREENPEWYPHSLAE